MADIAASCAKKGGVSHFIFAALSQVYCKKTSFHVIAYLSVLAMKSFPQGFQSFHG